MNSCCLSVINHIKYQVFSQFSLYSLTDPWFIFSYRSMARKNNAPSVIRIQVQNLFKTYSSTITNMDGQCSEDMDGLLRVGTDIRLWDLSRFSNRATTVRNEDENDDRHYNHSNYNIEY